MALTLDQTTRLLGAIQTDSLVFLCGAGLSIPPPTSLLSAVRVSQVCYDTWLPTEALDVGLRNDVDRLAGHFHARGTFEDVFIKIVPWDELVGPPNIGHSAIADLLISRAAHAALSANFDPAIEMWAENRKVALEGALTGQEAVDFAQRTNPLIKFHGCLRRDRKNTLWTHGQLDIPLIQERTNSCSQWISLNLPGKHLVVVGFWTDWGYLNDVLAAAFTINTAASVTVIDPSPSANLQGKAPLLWTNLNNLSRVFEHVQASGSDVLDELRTAYSKTWARKFYSLGNPLMQAAGGAVPAAATPDALSGDDLYNFRRDGEGVPYTRAATQKNPSPSAAQAALTHMLLMNSGATKNGSWLEHGGRLIRVVNGAGRAIADVREQHKEPSISPQPDVVVCAGAIDLGVPALLISTGRGASVVRPAGGAGAQWMTFEQARTVLHI